jgi:hypothetical protein
MTDPWSKAIDAGLSYLRTDGDAGDYRTSVEGVLRAALASMEADGLVVVPKEPTDDMVWSIIMTSGLQCGDDYAAMIAARPPFPESK